MTQEQLDKIESLLIEDKKRIQAQDVLPTNTDDIGDDIDLANAIADNAFSTSVLARNEAHLKKIDLALDRLKAGTYGLCIICEEHIDFRRLLARPITDMCVSCKQEQERFNKGAL